MKKFFLLVFCLATQCCLLTATERQGFTLEKDLAQYGESDYANVVHVARGISLEKAFAIAESNPEIGYFVYLKGRMMVLPLPSKTAFDHAQDPFGLVSETNFQYDSGALSNGLCRIFRHGDTVFFKKEGMWLGSAKGLADTYIKN